MNINSGLSKDQSRADSMPVIELFMKRGIWC